MRLSKNLLMKMGGDRPIDFKTCPRCGDYGWESLESYGHCLNCSHFVDFQYGHEPDVPPDWKRLLVGGRSYLTLRKKKSGISTQSANKTWDAA
jgi:hypothetical protein